MDSWRSVSSGDPPFDRLAVVGKAFANATRLQIIQLLAQSERSVEELVQLTSLGLSTVSAHLQILRAANLVRTRREGTRIHYRLAGDDIAALYAALGAVGRAHSTDVEAALTAYLGSGGGEVGEVTRAEVARRLAEGTITLVDVRPSEEYAAGHIPGAVSVPLAELVARIPSLSPEREIVAYCRGAYCVLAHDAVTLARTAGREALRLEDGMLEWRQAGLPVAVGLS